MILTREQQEEVLTLIEEAHAKSAQQVVTEKLMAAKAVYEGAKQQDLGHPFTYYDHLVEFAQLLAQEQSISEKDALGLLDIGLSIRKNELVGNIK